MRVPSLTSIVLVLRNSLPQKWDQSASRFNLTYRYIDDVLSINNPEFEHYLCQMYPAELEIKDTTESTTSASYLHVDLLLSIGRDGQHTLRSTTNGMILISTSQTFRSWEVIFHLRQPMAFLSFNLYDTPGLAPRMNVLFWGPGDFPVSYLNRDTSWNAWNRHSGRFGDLIQQYGVSLSRMLSKWHSDQIPPISWPWYRTWPSPIMSGFHGAFVTARVPLRTPGSVPPLLDLLVLQLLRPDSSNLPCLYSTFHPEYPLVLSRFCFTEEIRAAGDF